MFALLVFVVGKNQLIDGDKHKAEAKSLSVSTSAVKAPRGEILDSNGNPLVVNRQGNVIVFKYSEFPSAKDQERRNELIHSLIKLFEENKIEWIDRLPIVYEKNKLVVDKDKGAEFKFMVSEIMREKILLKFDKEIPHGIAIVINEFYKKPSGTYEINLDIICEKQNHKSILIGKQGAAIKRVNSYARESMEKFLDAKVFLTTYVKVKENWRDSDIALSNFGYKDQM